MSTQLPPPAEIRRHYDELLRQLDGEYIQHRWGSSEPQRRHFRQTKRSLVWALSGVSTVGRVLEIGAGPAVWTPLFLAEADSVLLVDISQEMLTAAAQRIGEIDGGAHASKVRYFCGDFVAGRPEDAGTFDTIVSIRAFEYMSDKAAFIHACDSLLRPGGTLILVTKNRAWRDQRRPSGDDTRDGAEETPVGVAMQRDLVPWPAALTMLGGASFSRAEAYPVVLGSYLAPFTWPGALTLLDRMHGWYYRKPMRKWMDPIVESYVVVAQKPS